MDINPVTQQPSDGMNAILYWLMHGFKIKKNSFYMYGKYKTRRVILISDDKRGFMRMGF